MELLFVQLTSESIFPGALIIEALAGRVACVLGKFIFGSLIIYIQSQIMIPPYKMQFSNPCPILSSLVVGNIVREMVWSSYCDYS
jgi:hypothetical protein